MPSSGEQSLGVAFDSVEPGVKDVCGLAGGGQGCGGHRVSEVAEPCCQVVGLLQLSSG